MAQQKTGSLDRRIATLREAADKSWRKVVARQAQAMTRYGTELAKVGKGRHGAQDIAGSLLKVAVDEGGRYAEDVYRAGLDYYKALIAFYGEGSPSGEGAAAAPAKQTRGRRRAPRGKRKAPAKRQRSTRSGSRP